MSLQITMNKKTHDIHMVMSRASIPFVFNSYHFYQLFYVSHFIQQQSLYHKLILTCSYYMSNCFNITILIIILKKQDFMYYIILYYITCITINWHNN